ncbi:ABC-2 transporter permease [Bacillus sp. HMF5848]|uniref:ABC-2 transporter permease n=1 Tax=Bacillus sp. HMF5848 TaxID=2495421 RepID=UPI000F7B0638|nr:ABC-2 transporter permease [Bacillus sp. HMF5848]RSK25630.1 ABC-2 transporter permease [Bacillus sp. HMF5848]
MFSLLYKDILLQKKLLVFGVVYIMIMIVAFNQAAEAMFIGSIVALTYMMTLTCCAYDDKNKTDVLLNSLPINKLVVVLSRYVSVFMFAAIAVVYYVAIAFVLKLIQFPFEAAVPTLEAIIGGLVGLAFINSVYFPIFFRLGYIKSKIVNFVLFFGVFLGLGSVIPSLAKKLDSTAQEGFVYFFTSLSEIQIMAGMIAVIIILLSSSFALSLYFYKRREF